MPRYCPNCGVQVQDDFNICPRCGTSIPKPAFQQQITNSNIQSQSQYPSYNQSISSYPQQQSPYYQRPSRNFSAPHVVSLIFVIVAIIILFISLVGPWYNMTTKYDSMGGSEVKSSVDYYLDKVNSSSNLLGETISDSKTYEELRDETKENMEDISEYSTLSDSSYMEIQYDYYDNLYSIGNITTYLIIITAIIAFFIILAIVLNFLMKNNTIRIIGGIFCVITFVLILLTVFNFMFAFTDAQNTLFNQEAYSSFINEDISFWYYKEQSGVSLSLGPSYSWYLMIITGILILLAGVLLFIKPTNQKNPAYQQNYYNPM